MYITDNIDPAFRFEDLARFTFDNCKKYGDPWNYSAQEVYINFMQPIGLQGHRILSTILNKLIYDNRGNENCQKLIEVEESIWSITTQNEAISIINKTISILSQ